MEAIIVWTEGNEDRRRIYNEKDKAITRFVQVRRYDDDIVVERREFDPERPAALNETVIRGGGDYIGRMTTVVDPAIVKEVVSPYATDNELTRAAIRWYDTGEWELAQ